MCFPITFPNKSPINLRILKKTREEINNRITSKKFADPTHPLLVMAKVKLGDSGVYLFSGSNSLPFKNNSDCISNYFHPYVGDEEDPLKNFHNGGKESENGMAMDAKNLLHRITMCLPKEHGVNDCFDIEKYSVLVPDGFHYI